MRQPQRPYSFPEPPWLLVSDVDDTLLGDESAVEELCQALRGSPALLLAINSSRPWTSVEQSLSQSDVPIPCAASICAMGTAVRIDNRPVSAWTQRFAGWDRRIVDELMSRAGFEPHPAELQTPFKASFAVPHERWEETRRAVEATGLPARIITSGQSDFDVLAPGAGKDHATLFLAQELGIPSDRLIVAGDSGNDHAMFQVAPRGIVVGNARPELRDTVDAARAYFASAPRAAGILEGLRHYGVPLGDDALCQIQGAIPCGPIAPTS